MEETWKILISDAPSEVGAAQPQPAQTSASQEEASLSNKKPSLINSLNIGRVGAHSL